MNWLKPSLSIMVLLFFAVGLAACTSEESQFSPQEVVNAALKEADETTSYYAEYTMHFSDDESDFSAKEWVSEDGKRRVEIASGDGDEQSIAINDGQQLSVYDQASNTVNIMKFSSEDQAALMQQSPRQQAEHLLKLIKDTHDFTNEADEKVAGRDTFHIVAKTKDDASLIGDQDIWIDKETWMVLKSVSKSAHTELTQEYTKIDFKPKLEEELFVLDFPEDATVEVMDDESYAPKEVSLEDVKESLGSYYQIPETDGLQLDRITVLEGIEDRPEYSFDYKRNDLPAFSLTVLKPLPNAVDFGQVGAEEELTIRGQQGTKMDSSGFRFMEWEEDVLQYNIILENPEIDFDEALTYLESMKLTEE